MRNISTIVAQLEVLGLTKDETALFVQLLSGPKNQLELSRITGIVRSNVYRIIDGMADKGLVCEIANDKGRVLISAQPDALELLVLEQEALASTRRTSLTQLVPMLGQLSATDDSFSIKTYRGKGGMKQMLWNELSAQTEVLLFSGDILDLATGHYWAEKYRLEVIKRGLRMRSIENPDPISVLSEHDQYTQFYRRRFVSRDVLNIQFELSIRDDTIAVYNSLADDTYLGTEIANPFLAAFMRQIFEHYWSIGEERAPDRQS